jgi:hypothetical protein
MRNLLRLAGWLATTTGAAGCAGRTGEIGGVLRLADGSPAPGAPVLLMQVPRDSVGGNLVLTWADSCGHYRVPHLPRGRYVVDASAGTESVPPADTVALRAGEHRAIDRLVTAAAFANAGHRHVRACE